ncbi:carboxypeptidase regulatory-like domain-containing protein [Psychrobacter sp. APC 3426]|uniref:carboxypeptidase regulatory-like domain-containing protein n=1 Tax=Psychrobacter sp. APC 3426 TaxID=3035177 RepID=UPI0025B5AB12|nr:carboxypeptidase regulatory-like domain-containing protein [Psychrobacter sp. APC 3426]MDN3397900.1 carboxypeptidase regulatory-like domain-containing protein [Psychrobacter sp. APC 3426]
MSHRITVKSKQLLTASLIATLMLAGCNNDSDNTVITPSNPSITVGSILGTVVDQASLVPIANATVSVAGQTYQTDANGQFELNNLQTGQSVNITITAEGYPARNFSTSISGNTPLEVEYQLTNDATVVSTTQLASEAVNLSIDELGAQVIIPPNALQRADGQPIVGNVTVEMDVVTPSIDPEEMPGGYGIVGGGFMESWGALIITATDSDNNELVLNDNNVASLAIPVSTRSLEPLQQQMPLFFYDAVQAGWVQTGSANLQTLDNNIQVYTAEVEQIGPWNVDVAMETVDVVGCVADTDGTRINNAVVKGDGINYSAITTAITDSNGNFNLPVRRDSQMLVVAQNGSRTSNAKSIRTLNTNYVINDGCLTVSTANDSLSIRLTWGEQPEDVDSHLLTPSGDHIYFGNEGRLGIAPFANLDVDDTDSFGPEFITVRNLMVGRYRYGVENYSETKNPGLKNSPITVFLTGPTIRSRTLTPSLNDNNNASIFWHSFDLVVDSRCNITYESVDRWLTTQESLDTFEVSPSTPTYCVTP